MEMRNPLELPSVLMVVQFITYLLNFQDQLHRETSLLYS